MDSPEVLWAHTRSEHASQSPFMVPELQPDWPPGFADDLLVWQPAILGAPTADMGGTGQLQEVAAGQRDCPPYRGISGRSSDMSEGGCFSQHATDSHLCLSTHLLTPPGYEQPGTGLHDPLAGFNTWLGHGQSDRQNLSVSPFADSDDLVGGSGSSSSTSSRDTTRQLGRVVIKSDNETLERNIRAQAGRQKGPQGLSKPASSDDDSPYCPGTDAGSDSEADESSDEEVKPKSATYMRLRRRRDARPPCRQDRIDCRRKQHNPWLVEETRALMAGVQRCGVGRWADIKRLQLPGIAKRSAVDLKDKWRNLVRLAALRGSASRTKADKRREVPADVVLQVRDLLHEAVPEAI